MHVLDQAVSTKHLLKHPFYQRWMDGSLTLGELQNYAKNYYPHVLAFPTYISSVHSQCEDLSLRQELLENLIEEERGLENHPELWLRFAEMLGVSRTDVENAETIHEARELVRCFKSLCQKSVASGLGALYAYESQVPEVARQKIEGLKKNYSLDDSRGTAFFTVHIGADEFHSATTKNAFDRLNEAEKEEAIEAANAVASALWNFLSGLDREYQNKEAA